MPSADRVKGLELEIGSSRNKAKKEEDFAFPSEPRACAYQPSSSNHGTSEPARYVIYAVEQSSEGEEEVSCQDMMLSNWETKRGLLFVKDPFAREGKEEEKPRLIKSLPLHGQSCTKMVI